MSETLEAIFEHGVFKPLRSPQVSEGQHVRPTVETASEAPTEGLLDLAAKVYQGLSDKQIREIEAIALNRADFFRR